MVLPNTLTTLLASWCVILPLFWPSHVRCLPVHGAGKGLLSTRECFMKCTPPSEQSAVLLIGSNPLPFRTFDCSLSSHDVAELCTLNISKIFQRLPSKGVLSVLFFIVSCTSRLKVMFRRPTHFTKLDIILALHVQGPCEISAKNLAVWGQVTNLLVLHLVNGVVLREEKNQTASDLEGLFGIHELLLRSLPTGIPRMFTTFVWKKLADVHFDNMSLTSIPRVLNQTIPYLQSLKLSHNRLLRPPDFPWFKARLELPYNLSRVAFQGEHYTQGATVNPRTYRRFLSIEFNLGLDISNYEFNAGSLDKISFRGNGLQRINGSMFDKISELQVVDLSQNKLREIPVRIFRKASGLVGINMSNNWIEFLDRKTFRDLQELRTLDLSSNVIHTLQSGLLDNLENIAEINLENNSLKRIEHGALPFGSNSIKKINLKDNNLCHIPKGTFLSHNVKLLDMSNNMVDHRSFLNTLDDVDLTVLKLTISKFTSYFHKKYQKFVRMPMKIVLKLENNKIMHFDSTQFNKTRLQKFKLILKAYTLILGNNPVVCDCRVEDLQLNLLKWTRNEEEINIAEFESWRCNTPERLRGAKVLQVPKGQLKCETSYPRCPSQCECYERSSGLPILVDCRNRNLTELPDQVPDGSVELRMEYNEIHNLTFHDSLSAVTSVYVSFNKIRRIRLNISSKLKEIFLRSNQLATLPENFQTFNWSKIDIRNNFFECDCRNKWMKSWLLRVNHSLVGGAESVFCSSGKNKGKLLISLKDDNFICSFPETRNGYVREMSVHEMLAYILAGLLSTFTVLTFLYRFKGEFKLLLFTRLRWHPFDRVDDSDPSMLYDAFVSYSSRDIQWVMQTLKENLEGEDPPYRLCIHDRDFVVGASIHKNIFDSVKTSRRMIMVLSKNFIESEWCMLEFRAAHRKVLRDRTNYLIIVLFDDIDTKKLDDELNLYLRTNTYLNKDNKWFWERLKYALPQNRHGRSQRLSAVEETVAYVTSL